MKTGIMSHVADHECDVSAGLARERLVVRLTPEKHGRPTEILHGSAVRDMGVAIFVVGMVSRGVARHPFARALATERYT